MVNAALIPASTQLHLRVNSVHESLSGTGLQNMPESIRQALQTSSCAHCDRDCTLVWGWRVYSSRPFFAVYRRCKGVSGCRVLYQFRRSALSGVRRPSRDAMATALLGRRI
jgi:hypothetical protein